MPIAIHCNCVTPFWALWYLNLVIKISDIALVTQPSVSSVDPTFLQLTIGILVNEIGKLI